MRKHRINCPILIERLPKHDKCKTQFLSMIEQSPGEVIASNEMHHDVINRGDYYINKSSQDFCNIHEYQRSLYQQLFLSLTHELVKKMSRQLFNFEYSCVLGEPNIIWYQQYQKNNTHSWHDHALNSTFSVIYYLELPRGVPGTEFLDPYTGRKHYPKVREGDILMFPSILAHRSPPNKSIQRKTIISSNYI